MRIGWPICNRRSIFLDHRADVAASDVDPPALDSVGNAAGVPAGDVALRIFMGSIALLRDGHAGNDSSERCGDSIFDGRISKSRRDDPHYDGTVDDRAVPGGDAAIQPAGSRSVFQL